MDDGIRLADALREVANVAAYPAIGHRLHRRRWDEADLDVDLVGHRYRAMRIDGDDLSAKNPFRLLADSDPAIRADMGRQTLAVVAVTFADGRNGFVLLNDRANILALDFAASSKLLDQDCAVLN